jgi:phosphatidylserine/phosphatidylglycerophosphate/cardiolipin synthase-like enzyme
LCRAAADGTFSGVTRLPDICVAAGLAEVRSSAVDAALAVGASCGLFSRCEVLEWQPEAMSLEAVPLYRDCIHIYWVPRQSGYETFHAKVILSDDRMAYVGSAHMTQPSLSVSMELGVLLKGDSVKTPARVVDAVLNIAPRLN